MSINIRLAVPEDAAALLDIYRPYVEKTAITFEYDVPTVSEFESRIRGTLEKYPYLVVEDETGVPVGYCYASGFKDRQAYERSIETSIYLRENQRVRHDLDGKDHNSAQDSYAGVHTFS